jgi:hypothetical protein
MKKQLLIASLLAFFSLPAAADTITITLTTPAGLCMAGCSRVFTDVGTAKPNTLQTNIVQVFQSGCNTSINGTCTAAQVLNYWAGTLRDTFVGQVNAFQLQVLQNAVPYVPIAPN